MISVYSVSHIHGQSNREDTDLLIAIANKADRVAIHRWVTVGEYSEIDSLNFLITILYSVEYVPPVPYFNPSRRKFSFVTFTTKP